MRTDLERAFRGLASDIESFVKEAVEEAREEIESDVRAEISELRNDIERIEEARDA